jgi:hypothetical protein
MVYDVGMGNTFDPTDTCMPIQNRYNHPKSWTKGTFRMLKTHNLFFLNYYNRFGLGSKKNYDIAKSAIPTIRIKFV